MKPWRRRNGYQQILVNLHISIMITSKKRGNAKLPIVETGQKNSSVEMGKYEK
jgi:hypothetical protein